MKTRFPGLALLLVAALTSCAKNDASIEVLAICGFPDSADKCVTSGKCDTFLAGRPWASTQVAPGNPPTGPYQNSLDLYVQINNQQADNSNADTLRVNTNDFTIEEYRLSYSSTPSIPIPAFTYPVNQSIPAGGSFTPLIKFIPPQVMASIDAGGVPEAVVEVTLKVFGHTRDGHAIETAPFVLPADVLAGVAFDPNCAGTSQKVTAVCPHDGQTSSYTCQ